MHLRRSDGLIVITGNTTVTPIFYLDKPTSVNTGTFFKFKNLSNRNIHLSCNDSDHDYFVYENTKETSNIYNVTDNGLTVISDGSRWLVFK